MKRFFLLGAAVMAAEMLWAGHFNGGRVVPVHRLAPVDAQGDKVSAGDSFPAAISQTKTCGQCHEVNLMAGGSHFRAASCTNNVARTCNFEPWFLVAADGSFKSFANPSESGLTAWEFTKQFGRAFPGGGVGADEASLNEVGGDHSRWQVTGPLEMNCLACHEQGDYDPSEWAKQILRENFAGAALAAASLARVEGMNERLDSTWDAAFQRENPDDHLFRVPEKIVYDPMRFNDKNQCVFRVGKPKNERCLACHTAAEVGVPSHTIAGDVHLQRGMKCVDCHTSGMDHRIETKSCAACHFGKHGEGPRPIHKGIPLVHFEKLACTVCHSGVTREGKRAQVRTARANRIGLYGKAQWATDIPYIIEPVFVRTMRGVIEPCRMAWSKAGDEGVFWPFAHDVKPARQARGAEPNKCADCHTADSDFFCGKITPIFMTKDGPQKGAPICSSKFLGADPLYHSILGFTFMFRPFFKVFLWTIFGFLCLFAAAAAAAALVRISKLVSQKTDHFLWGAFKWLLDAGLIAAILYLAASGVLGFLLGGMTWWWLVLHMVAGGAFAAAIFFLVFFRTAERTEKTIPAFVWALWVVLACGVVFTAVMPMMTVFGGHGQLVLLWAHRCVSITFVLFSVALCYVARRR